MSLASKGPNPIFWGILDTRSRVYQIIALKRLRNETTWENITFVLTPSMSEKDKWWLADNIVQRLLYIFWLLKRSLLVGLNRGVDGWCIALIYPRNIVFLTFSELLAITRRTTVSSEYRARGVVTHQSSPLTALR